MTAAARVGQLTREQLATMSPEEITAARRAGRLAVVLGGRPPLDDSDTGQLDRADLATMTPAEIAAARRAGRLTEVLGGPAPVA